MNDHQLPARPLYLEVDTFADLAGDGEPLHRWLRAAHDSVFLPMYERLPAPPFGAEPVSDWGPPRGFWAGITTETFPGLAATAEPYGPEAFAALLDAVAQGAVRRLSLAIKPLDEHGYPSNRLGGVDVGFDLAGAEYDGAAHAVFVAASEALLDDVEAQADAWVALGTLAAATVGCATGYVTLDYAGPHESPYERSIDRYWLDARRECDRLLRGYYWANFLGEAHVAALGGAAALAAAPASVERLADAPGVVLARLPGSPAAVTDEALRTLRDYLRPALPPPDPTYEYEGPLPLRVVSP